jgi:hypothetical protein
MIIIPTRSRLRRSFTVPYGIKLWSRTYQSIRACTQNRKTFAPALVDNAKAGEKQTPLENIKQVVPEEWRRRIQSMRSVPHYHSINSYRKACIPLDNLISQIVQLVSGLDPELYRDTTVIEVNPGISNIALILT